MLVTFRSKHKQLRVHFDAIRFGRVDSPEDGDYEKDVSGRIVTVVTDDPAHPGKQVAVPVRRKIPIPAAQFYDSMLTLDDAKPMQRIVIDALRKTINGEVRDKRGQKFMRPDELWEETNATSQLISQLSGQILVSIPDPLTDEDLDMLAKLETCFHHPVPNPAIGGAMAALDKALDRFQVRGIASPSPDRAQKQCRARIIDLCYALEDAAKQLGIALPLNLESKAKDTA